MQCYVSILILWIFSLSSASSNNTSDPSITSVTPEHAQRTTERTLQLTIDNLPALTGQFLCVFTIADKILVTNATKNNFGVNCTTPSSYLLPRIPAGHHHFTAKLSVNTTNNPEFVHTIFTFFDCHSYKSCMPCVSSTFPCNWCVHEHRCTHDTAKNCRNDNLVTGGNRAGSSYGSGPKFCPAINTTTDGSSEILVPAGTKKSIHVNVHIIDQFLLQTLFWCEFKIGDIVTRVKADLIGDTINCEAMEFTYRQPGANATATLAVVWAYSKSLDNPNDIHVVVYKCNEMAKSSNECSVLEEKYNCVWCQSTNSCELNNQCKNTP